MGRKKRGSRMGTSSSSSGSVSKSSPVDGLNTKVKGYYGLENQGATCYLNSVLQVLFMTRDFREALRSHIDNKCINHQLNSVFDTLLKRTAETLAITRLLGINNVHEQRDAAECFEKILRLTSSDASKIFKGELKHTSTCSTCGRETKDQEPFWTLPLTLVDSDTEDYSVIDGIKSFFQESCIRGENQLYCEHCKLKADSRFKCDVVHHPDVLTLLLKRFKFDYSHMQHVKLKCRVQIPDTLTIPDAGGKTYQLYAFVEHLGDLRHGHYTVTIKSQDDEEWYNFNDTLVTLVKQPYKMDSKKRSQNAYLLFYRKGSAEDDSIPNTTEVSTLEDAGGKNEDMKPEMSVREDKDGKSGADNNSNVSMKPQHLQPRQQSETECFNGNVEVMGDERLENDTKRRGRQKQNNPEQTFKQIQSSGGIVGDTKSTLKTKEKHKPVSDKEGESRVDENHQNKQNHEVRSKRGASDKSGNNQENKQEDNADQNRLDRHQQQEMRHEDAGHEGHITCKPNISDSIKQNQPSRERKEAGEAEAGNHPSMGGQGTKTDERVFTVKMNQNGKIGVENQRDEGMTGQYRVLSVNEESHRLLKTISLCNTQIQNYGGEGDSKESASLNNQKHKQAVNDCSDKRQEHHGESEEASDNGPFEDVSLRSSQEDLGRETATQVTKGGLNEVNGEADPDLKAGEVDSSSVCNQSQKESSEPHGDVDSSWTKKAENSSETQSLAASNGDIRTPPTHDTQTETESKQTERSDKKRKKGQNKQKLVLFYQGP